MEATSNQWPAAAAAAAAFLTLSGFAAVSPKRHLSLNSFPRALKGKFLTSSTAVAPQ